MKSEFLKAIEEHYNITIEKCVRGPQQFVAKTTILSDSKGNQYFCKVVENALLIPGIVKTLPGIEQMYKNGINWICYPIRGKMGLHFFVGNTLIVLYNYIEVSQGFEYSLFTLGSLIAKVHNITPQITAEAPKESFEFPNRELFVERFEGTLHSTSRDPIIQELKKLLQTHEREVHHYMTELVALGELCKEGKVKLVLTHGDLPTNVLVKSPNDIYIIDWDEMRLAPAERDLWMKDEIAEYIEGYKSVRPDFVVNQNSRRFCILQYYFERMNLHFSDILDSSADFNFRLKRVQKLAQGRMAGWNLPKVEGRA